MGVCENCVGDSLPRNQVLTGTTFCLEGVLFHFSSYSYPSSGA